MVIPMPPLGHSSIPMPRDRSPRMKHIEPVREGPGAEAYLLAEEVKIGVVGHLADEFSRGKNKVS